MKIQTLKSYAKGSINLLTRHLDFQFFTRNNFLISKFSRFQRTFLYSVISIIFISAQDNSYNIR